MAVLQIKIIRVLIMEQGTVLDQGELELGRVLALVRPTPLLAVSYAVPQATWFAKSARRWCIVALGVSVKTGKTTNLYVSERTSLTSL